MTSNTPTADAADAKKAKLDAEREERAIAEAAQDKAAADAEYNAVYERFADAAANGHVHPALAELLAQRFGPKES